jgi:cytochrome P450
MQAMQFVQGPHDFMERCQARYGDVFTMRLPGRPPVVVVSEPEAVRWLVSSGYDELMRSAEEARYILGDHSVLFQHDAQHRQTRKLLLPPFHGDRMRAYGPQMAEIADARIREWRVGSRYTLCAEMEKISLQVIFRCVFGISEPQQLAQLSTLILQYLASMLAPWMYASTLLFTGLGVRRFLRAGIGRKGDRRRFWPRRPLQSLSDCLGSIEAILLDQIVRCRRLPAEELAQRTDILSMLVAARFDDGSALSDEVLRDHLLTLLLAAYETTAATLAWTLYGLMRHPATMERARAEVHENGFEPARSKNPAYIGAAINESMRLYPISTMVSRELKHETSLAGRPLPAGTIVSPCTYLVHRDARAWEQPTAFLPERFLSGKASVYQFLPFGAGVWRCLGAQFAEYQMRVVLARLVAQADFEIEPRTQIRPVLRGIIVAPSEGLPVRVTRVTLT